MATVAWVLEKSLCTTNIASPGHLAMQRLQPVHLEKSTLGVSVSSPSIVMAFRGQAYAQGLQGMFSMHSTITTGPDARRSFVGTVPLTASSLAERTPERWCGAGIGLVEPGDFGTKVDYRHAAPAVKRPRAAPVPAAGCHPACGHAAERR